MELDNVLLGLIRLHQGVTGYDLNRIIRESTGYLMSASLSHIYPTLKRLHDRGLVSYVDTPLKNRPAKKTYTITPVGDDMLRAWLETPVEAQLDFKPFLLKMAFSPLMRKAVLLGHIQREIACREKLLHEREQSIQVEVDYLDKQQFDLKRAETLWESIYQVQYETESLRLDWLKAWYQKIEQGLTE